MTDSNATDGPPPADDEEEWKSPFIEKASAENTSLGTLIGIGVGGLVVGVVLVIWGVVAVNSFGTGYPVQKDPGTTQLVLGSAFLSIGVTALLILAGVRAVIWHLDSSKVAEPK